MCLIQNGYRDGAVWIYKYKSTVIGNVMGCGVVLTTDTIT